MNRKLSLVSGCLGVLCCFFALLLVSVPVVYANLLVADFIEDATIGSAPFDVYFVDHSQGTPASWDWDFGDGTTGTGEFLYHTFTSPGIYSVSLVVADGVTSSEKIKTGLITVTYPTITALLADLAANSFGADQVTGSAPLAVHFNDLSLPDSWIWSWDFGDGSSSNEPDPIHSYFAAGTYTVSLTISDSGGTETQTISNLINVSEPAETIITFREGFENVAVGRGSIDALGWTVVNNDGDLYHDEPLSWAVGYDDTATYAHSGVKSLVAFWYHRADLADPVLQNDDWLLLPPISIPDGYKAIYSFWAKAFSSKNVEDFNVKLATAGRQVSDFTETLAEVRSQNEVWRQFSYDLSAYAGQTVNLAVQYISLNQFGLVVDDVSVVVVPPGEGDSALVDADGDGVADIVDSFPNDGSEWLDTDMDGIGNNIDPDDDGDGMPDSWEIAYGLGPLLAADAATDIDGDGESNLAEYLGGQDPLANGVTISGRLVGEDGAPLSGIWVEASSSLRALQLGGVTDGDGFYALRVPSASDYIVSVPGDGVYPSAVYDGEKLWKKATPVDVSGGPVSGINFELSAGLTIAGTVSGLSSGQAVSVEAWSDSTNGWGFTTITGAGGGSDSFTIGGLAAAGDYRLVMRSDNYQSGYVKSDGSVGGWAAATILSSGATGVSIVVADGFYISGTISGLSAGDVIWVNAWSESTGLWGSVEVRAVGGEEQFMLTGLGLAVDYRLSFSSDDYGSGFFVGSPGGVASALGSWSAATLIDLTQGNIGGIDVAAGPAVIISGTVSGLQDGDTALLTAWSAAEGFTRSVKVTGTGADFDYAITGLSAAADYQVMVSAEGYVAGYYSLGGLTGKSGADLIDASATVTGINLPLALGNMVTGTIFGLGVGEEVWVEAWSETAECWAATCLVGEGSSVIYTLGGLSTVTDLVVSFRAAKHPVQVLSGIDTSANPQGVSCVLAAGYSVSGTISGATAHERITVTVDSLARGSHQAVTVFADAAGSAAYTINGLGVAADYILLAETATRKVFYGDVSTRTGASVVEVSNVDLTGVDISLAAVTVYTLSGAVNGVDLGSLVWIDVWDEACGMWSGTSRRGPGLFSLTLPAGSNYKLGLYAEGYVDAYYGGLDPSLLPIAVNDISQAVSIDLGGADNSIGGLLMTAGSSYSGRIYFDADGDTLADLGEELADATIEVSGGSIVRSCNTDKRGEFFINGLFPGGTVIGGETFDGVYEVAVASRYGSYHGSITIAAVGVTTASIVIEATTGEIHGTVTESTGEPVANATVLIFDGSGLFVNAILTDVNGQYRYSGLGGTYKVKIDREGDQVVDYTSGSLSVTTSSSLLYDVIL